MTAIRTDDGNSRDHWVPQFYLRHWIAGPEKKLSAFWRESGRERHSRCSPRAVLSENHLYSVYGVDGTFIHGESLVFKDIDNAAAPAFEYLTDGNWRELPQQHVESLYRFIYTLAPRSRHVRERFIQWDERSQLEMIGRFCEMGLPDAEQEVGQFWSLFASPRDRAAFQMLLIARLGDAWKRFFYDIPLHVYEIGDVDAEFLHLMNHCVAARRSTLRTLYMSSRYHPSAAEFGRITAEALRQIYYDPSNHMREVWLYVQRGFAQTA